MGEDLTAALERRSELLPSDADFYFLALTLPAVLSRGFSAM
jgi:hypothetical protein